MRVRLISPPAGTTVRKSSVCSKKKNRILNQGGKRKNKQYKESVN